MKEKRENNIYEEMIERMRDIVLVIRVDGKILHVNKKAAKSYGYTKEELIGQDLSLLLNLPSSKEVLLQMKGARDKSVHFRTMHYRKNGQAFPIEMSSSVFDFFGEEATINVVRDISKIVDKEKVIDQKEKSLLQLNEDLTAANEELIASEEELKKQNEELICNEEKLINQNILLTSLHNIALSLIREKELNEVLEIVLSNATFLLGTTDGFINILDENDNKFYGGVAKGIFIDDINNCTLIDQGLVGEVYKKGRIVVVDDYKNWENRIKDPIFDDVGCLIGVPLKEGSYVVGVLGLGFQNDVKDIDKNYFYLLERLSDLASLAIFNSNLLKAHDEEQKAREKAEQVLLASEERYRTIFESVNDGIIVHDLFTGKILEVNQKICEMVGRSKNEIIKENLKFIGTDVSPYSEKEYKKKVDSVIQGQTLIFEWKIKKEDGQEVWVEINLKRSSVAYKDCVLAIVRDITERKNKEREFKHMAYYDGLTGLPNRSYLKEMLSAELIKAQQGKAKGVVLFIDLDDLKMVNDNFGHSCGDKVIVDAANIITEAVGKRGTVSRIGGDEFFVLLPDSAEETVTHIADKVVKSLNCRYTIGKTSAFLSASMGVAIYPRDGASAEELLKNADLALYDVKDSGKNNWKFYDFELAKQAYENMQLRYSLNDALENGELFLQYQPVFSVEGDYIKSFEALLRWNSPVHGMVPPSKFIPLAEEGDTIHKIGAWVIHEACQFIARLGKLGENAATVSINVSPKQLLADDFVPSIEMAIKEYQISPNRLCIEITENLLISSLEDGFNKLNSLKSMGVSLALDDFGTGYSSLNYLTKLPSDYIKIDKGFIDKITFDSDQSKLICSIIDMAHILGLKVVAEGVENKAQLEILQDHLCDFIQGYVYCRPVNEVDAFGLINATNAS